MMDPLQLPLRDVHYPEGIAWWPLAPGWWVLLVVLSVTAAIVWWRYRRRKDLLASALYRARQELSGLRTRYESDRNAGTLVRDISVLLRRSSISIYPRANVASLTGEAWLGFLDGPLPDRPFSKGPGRILTDAPYRPGVTAEQAEPLLDICAEWLERVGRYRAVEGA